MHIHITFIQKPFPLHFKLTCSVHLLVDASGRDKYMKASKVLDFLWQVRHCTVDLNWPWKSATIIDSLSCLCFCQAYSAALKSSRWSLFSSLCLFRLSAWEKDHWNFRLTMKRLWRFSITVFLLKVCVAKTKPVSQNTQNFQYKAIIQWISCF